VGGGPRIGFRRRAGLPYLTSGTKDALRRAAPQIGGVQINSSLRSVAQQFLIKKWRDARR